MPGWATLPISHSSCWNRREIILHPVCTGDHSHPAQSLGGDPGVTPAPSTLMPTRAWGPHGKGMLPCWGTGERAIEGWVCLGIRGGLGLAMDRAAPSTAQGCSAESLGAEATSSAPSWSQTRRTLSPCPAKPISHPARRLRKWHRQAELFLMCLGKTQT